MSTSAGPTPLSLLRHCHSHSLSSPRRPITFLSHLSLPHPTLRSYALPDNSSHVSWLSPDNPTPDTFRGWAFPDTPIPNKKQHSGFPIFLVAGVGTSVALLLFALAHNKGFRLPFRSSPAGLSVPVVLEAEESIITESDLPIEEDVVAETSEVDLPEEVVTEAVPSEKLQPRIVTFDLDSTQLEAVDVLKKLKIIDEDVKADKLCTRREYARWLVRASSLLERNPKYKITTAVALSGSVIAAYEDVAIGDQDFDFIQALAEAGVVSSKLPSKHYSNEGFKFSPERFLSRRDLIDWRAQLEYDFASTKNQEMLKTKLTLLDVREISSAEWPGLLMDMLAGDKSLLRRVFGQVRRLQPNKPSIVAQAAVALTSGRMTEAIQNELLRLEAEQTSREVTKEEIKQELLDRGELEGYWSKRMEEEKARGLEVQESYMNALNYLEQEKIAQESALNGFLKEKAAMECQKQLLISLKEEVSQMSERIISERAEQIVEEETAQTLRCDLLNRKEGVLDAKSLLEAEIEALQILRSWIEDEARRSEARSKVLEEVGRRWGWDR